MPPRRLTGKEDSMSGKTLILVIAVSATSLVAVAARRDRPAAVEAPPDRAGIGYTATVEVESLRVISYLDEDGDWRAPDSALVPPVPLQGPRQITIGPGRAPVQIADRLGAW
jgi:hypothetical protein